MHANRSFGTPLLTFYQLYISLC